MVWIQIQHPTNEMCELWKATGTTESAAQWRSLVPNIKNDYIFIGIYVISAR